MDRRKFLHIAWLNFLKPLLIIAAIFFTWKFLAGAWRTSWDIEISYSELTGTFALIIAGCFAAALVLIAISWLMKKVFDRFPVRVKTWVLKREKHITAAFFTILAILIYIETQNEIFLFIMVYYILRPWFSKNAVNSKNQFS